MAEYIEREALLMGMDRSIYGMRSRYGHDELLNHAIDLVQNARDFVAAQKTADVAPVVHGRWIYDEKAQRPYCSVCKGYFYGATNSPMSYCPNCGAKMDGSKA